MSSHDSGHIYISVKNRVSSCRNAISVERELLSSAKSKKKVEDFFATEFIVEHNGKKCHSPSSVMCSIEHLAIIQENGIMQNLSIQI